MNAGNVGDSEQRTQQLAGLQNNNTTALGNLLAKLAQGKASDVSNYRSQLQGKLSDAQQRNQSNQQRLMEAINSYRNQQEEKQGSLTKSQRNYGTKSTKVSHNDIFNFVNDSLSNGSSWAEIAEGAKSQGVDTSTGSYLDQLLNQANKQNRWA
jgi:t-SNARE complex subunit (syntaxin)